MFIVNATKEHIVDIVELWKELVDHHSKIDTFFTRRENGHINFKNFVLELIKSNDAKVLVAIQDNNVSGYIIAKIENYPPIYNIEKYGQIYDLCVSLKYRRNNIGNKLWQAALSWFKLKGLTRVELSIVPKNPEANSFWKKQGFKDHMHRVFLKIE